jgi:type IV pilus assembly protein PilF
VTVRFLAIVLLATGCISHHRIERAATRVDLGAAYIREGNTESAVAILEEAARLDPRNWQAANTLAVAYIAKNQPELAEREFDRALRLDPDEGEILVNYGAFLLKQGRTDEAVEALKHALADLDYKNPAMVESNLALALVQAGQPDEALGYAREAIRRQPTLCEAYFHLGIAHEARKDVLAAMEAYDQEIQACPKESVGARLRKGCMQVRVGMVDDGTALLRGVVGEAPGTAFADEARSCMGTIGG